MAPPAVPASPEFAEYILAGLEGKKVEPVQTSTSYRVALAVSALLVSLLPLVYLGIVSATVYGVYWHLSNHWSWVASAAEAGSGRNQGKVVALAALVYAAPALAGLVLTAFMLKPFLAPRGRRFEPICLNPQEEPLLFAFVHRLCDVVGAPRPQQILLDDEVNAAAARTSSVWNPFGRDLILVIGVPLAAGMSLRQLSGVLAHEFGHFSQGTAMWLNSVVSSVNRWFAYVVFHRDHWDEALDRWNQNSESVFWILVAFVRLCVWLTRKLLYGLMLAAHFVSCRLMREMEFDADRYEARLAGSDQFLDTSRRLALLATASRAAISDLREQYTEKRLADDYFRLLVHRADGMPEKIRKLIEEDRAERKTGWFDTHPADVERNASAQREAAEGLFHVDGPASCLFRDFVSTCKKETLKFYEYQVGEEMKPQTLVPVDEIVARQDLKQAENDAFDRVVPGLYHYMLPYPWPMSLEPSPLPPANLAARVQELRQRMPAFVPDHGQRLSKYLEPLDKEREANLAEVLLKAGVAISGNYFSEPLNRPGQVDACRFRLQMEKAEALEALRPRLDAVVERIILPLQLLAAPEMAQRLPHAMQRWVEARRLVWALGAMQRNWGPTHQGISRMQLLQDHFPHLERAEDHPGIVHSLLESAKATKGLLEPVWMELNGVPYPFDHADGAISIGGFLATSFPDVEEVGKFTDVADRFVEQLVALRSRMTARLCALVEEVETALGLPRMDPPPPPPPVQIQLPPGYRPMVGVPSPAAGGKA